MVAEKGGGEARAKAFEMPAKETARRPARCGVSVSPAIYHV